MNHAKHLKNLETVRDLLQKKAAGHALNFHERNIVNIYNNNKKKKSA